MAVNIPKQLEMKNTMNVEEIAFYLNRKRGYYEKILELTRAQDEAITTNNIEELNLIIIEKVNCIKEIKDLDKLNSKIQEEITSNEEYLISDKPLNLLLKQLKSIITEVMDYDRESIRLLNSSIDNTKAKIDNQNKKRRTPLSMINQGIRPASFIDVLH